MKKGGGGEDRIFFVVMEKERGTGFMKGEEICFHLYMGGGGGQTKRG